MALWAEGYSQYTPPVVPVPLRYVTRRLRAIRPLVKVLRWLEHYRQSQ